MKKPLTLLMTGSRDWPDAALLYQYLDKGYAHALKDEREMQLMHGACPTGADDMADRWCEEVGVKPLRRPADWNRYGHSAGVHRNAQMVAEVLTIGKPYVCVAFIYRGSPGATHCARFTERFGIPTYLVRL